MSRGVATILFCVLALLLPSLVHAQGQLETPAPNSFVSGIEYVRGWKCTAGTLTFTIDNGPSSPLSYGSSRADTQGVCGKINTGFIAQNNWNLAGTGQHTIRVYDNGQLFAQAGFTVTTLGSEFLTGQSGSTTLNFAGKSVTLTWQENQQNFVITGVQGGPTGQITPGLWTGTTSEQLLMCLNVSVSSSGSALVNSSQCTQATIGSSSDNSPSAFAIKFGPGSGTCHGTVSVSSTQGFSITNSHFSIPGSPGAPFSFTADGSFSSPNAASGSATISLGPPIVSSPCSSTATYTASPAGGSSSAFSTQEEVVEERFFVDPDTGQEATVRYNEAGEVVSIQIFIEETTE